MKLQINGGHPDPLGITYENKGVNFSFVSKEENCGIVFYNTETFEEVGRVKIPKENHLGEVYFGFVEGIELSKVAYNYLIGEDEITDIYAHQIYDERSYGERKEKTFGGFLNLKKSNVKMPNLSFEDSIFYGLHVRGFTKHPSSKVKPKLRGTFQGIVEKIAYLKELGVTTIELQPSYEFLETYEEESLSPYAKVSVKEDKTVIEPTIHHDYWGYQEGCYYAPKSLYASIQNASQEFYDLVQAFHKEKMEVIMQFYFPDNVSHVQIVHVLHFWAQNYCVDGFHIKGANIPVSLLQQDGALINVKLIFEQYMGTEKAATNHNCSEYLGEYSRSIRKLLKGDESSLLEAMSYIRGNQENKNCINYICDYAGFRLMDLVSYDRKHNEANGEANRDGCDQNYSWNCGEEGVSRKKSMKQLRSKQIKNALTLLFLSKGTPFLFMGDEFGNTQGGNNNPYCQDNEITWLNWKNLISYGEIFNYAKGIILLRKEMPILHTKNEFRMLDYKAFGYPDLSYHGKEAWNPCFAHYSRQIGSLYNCSYANEKDSYLYVAMNMHWESHMLGIPKLVETQEWEVLFSTEELIDTVISNKEIMVNPRSIILLKSKKKIRKKG